MNDKSVKMTLRPCNVEGCKYAFSDVHHILGRQAIFSDDYRIWLCPNHHRLAHLAQNFYKLNFKMDWIVSYFQKYAPDFVDFLPHLFSLVDKAEEHQRELIQYAKDEARRMYEEEEDTDE